MNTTSNQFASELPQKYPPSDPCSCHKCLSYCYRPGWWTVEEAERVISTQYAFRMMLEISPEMDFGVLSPSFKGNEGNYALEKFSKNGCTFLKNNLCQLFDSGFQPLECRYCHHERTGRGTDCHNDIEEEWKSLYAKKLILRWGNKTGFWHRQGLYLIEKKDTTIHSK
jgi:hypothetical protein